jgi:hypothetical protein
MLRIGALTLVGILLGFLAGCCWEVGNRASMGLTVDLGKLGTGEPVVYPTNDDRYWHGVPMDLRRKP